MLSDLRHPWLIVRLLNRFLVCSQVLPYFHFYRGNEGRLAAFSASLKKIDRLKVQHDILLSSLHLSCWGICLLALLGCAGPRKRVCVCMKTFAKGYGIARSMGQLYLGLDILQSPPHLSPRSMLLSRLFPLLPPSQPAARDLFRLLPHPLCPTWQ